MLFWTIPAPPVSSGGSGPLDNWIAEIGGGSREALAALYGETRGAVYGFALSLCKNVQDAEDVLQEVYLQVWRAAGAYRSQGKPMAWLLTIARNLALMRLRERQRAADPQEDWQAQLAATAAPAEDRLVLESLLAVLTDQERQVVTLHALAGLKHREIGELLDLPLPTVLSKYHRALQKLRNSMKEAE